MELLDGVSLADFIQSQSEKGHRVKEDVIWTIVT
jgi:hemerythrin-like domain-containing protein